MKTGSFRTYRGEGRISIARWAGGFGKGVPSYRPLAPGPWFKSVDWPTYCRLYGEQLSKLDPRQTWDDLHRLAGDAAPVLLCWEVPPFTDANHCHRRLVAEWFEQELGEAVPEVTP